MICFLASVVPIVRKTYINLKVVFSSIIGARDASEQEAYWRIGNDQKDGIRMTNGLPTKQILKFAVLW